MTRHDRSWFYIAVLTLAVAVAWAALAARDRLRQATVPADVTQAAAPLNPRLDKTVLDKLQERNL